ncbi:MAG: translocation/assembly module TamB domain-containing protein [Moraxella sp.]|nr:translocation/assembly module TamB domain-containing protein [Moraxella sp.]
MSDVKAPPAPTNPIKRGTVWLLVSVLAVFVLLAVAVFYVLTTPDGTRWVLSNIATRTGVSLTYERGTLYDGIDVSGVSVQAGDITISADKAHLKLGWRAVLLKQVHLMDAHINELVITNPNSPTGEPFDYPTVSTPVAVYAYRASATTVRYEQATKDPVMLYDIYLNQARWLDTKVSVSGGRLDYDHMVKVDKVAGDITLTDGYPLDAVADVWIAPLEKVYFDPLQAHFQGTLKRTHGTLTSRYNQHAIRGEFVAQGLSDDAPFSARLDFDKVVLPYADSQNITLTDGVITADGTTDEIELRVNTDMVGKDIPKGRYQGRGVIKIDDDGMDVTFLQANTASGVLTAKGKMSWADKFVMSATVTGDAVKVRELMPLEYQEYQAYLPTTLTGTLGVNYWYLDKDNNTKWAFDLRQKDGEQVQATLSQSQAKPNLAWHINADWQKLIRHRVPHLDKIDSPHGTAHVIVKDGKTDIHAKALIHELSVAPKGDYDVTASILGRQIKLPKFSYDGDVGVLSGRGDITLAHKDDPLSWRFDINSKKLMPNAYLGDDATPIDSLSGSVSASGVMSGDKQAKHDISIKHSDLTAVMKDGSVHLTGSGAGVLVLAGGELKNFKATFDGDISQTLLPQLPKTAIKANASGDLMALSIHTLGLKNPFLQASVAGKVGLKDGVAWDLVADVAHLDTQKFVQDSTLIAKIQGKLSTKGRHTKDNIEYVQAVFDGKLREHELLVGDVSFDVLGRGDGFNINHVRHQGRAGDFWAKGKVDLAKLSWDLVANMKGFNVGAFVKNLKTDLTGGFATHGVWGQGDKVVSVDGLNLTGQFNGQPLNATGSLFAKLRLPKDLPNYFNRLKSATKLPKTPNDFFALQQQIQDNSRQTQHIFQTLKADNLTIQMGDNVAKMGGTERHLTTTLDIKELNQLWSDAQGVIQGGLIIMNDKHALPTVYADLTAKDVRTADIIVQRASVLGKIVNLAQSPSHVRLEVDNIIALGRVVQNAYLDFQGTQINHRVSFGSKNASLQAQAVVTGGFDGERYQGVLSDGQMQSRFGQLFQRQPSEFGYVLDSHEIKVAPHCWQTTGTKSDKVGVLCLPQMLHYSPKGGDVDVVIQNLDTSVLSPALPSDMVWQSTLNGKIKANWQAGKAPFVNAVLYSDKGQVGVTQDDTGYVQMPYERISLIAQTLPTGFKIRADVAGTAGQGYADVLIDPYGAGKPIKGVLALSDINLAVVRPFFPDLQTLSGKIDIAGGISGVLNKPLFYGNAELSGGRLAMFGVPLTLTDIEANVAINGTRAKLDGQFVAGEGKGVIDGQIDWQGDLQAKIGILGEHLTVSSPPLLTASISPELEIIIKPLKSHVDIKGVVFVPSATIRPPQAGTSIVGESADVSVLDRRLMGNINRVLAEVKPWSINADIGLDLGNDVSFRGFGTKLPLAGTLHLTQMGQGSMRAFGVIQVSERTKIDGIGQNLELNYAQIRFNGDMLNPRLSIEGEKEIQGQTVGLRVKGTANDPDITVFNNAGLTEQQAMNALITGRIDEASDAQASEQAFNSQVANSLAAAGLSLGLSGTRSITNQIGQALGFDSLTVDASGNSSDTSVNITGYLSPDLYLRYGVGVFNAESTLSMRYQLTRRVYIEATRAVENTVDVIYRWKF